MSDSDRARKRGKSLLLAGIAVAVVLAGGRILSGALGEVLWFQSTGYTSVFWKLFWLRAGTVAVVGTLAGVLLFTNMKAVASSLGRIRIRRRFGNLEFVEQVPHRIIALVTLGLAVVLGLWFGLSAPSGTGLQVLLTLQAPAWGEVDQVLGRDLSFYVFLLPLLQSLTAFALVLAFLLFFMCVVGYAATGVLGVNRGRLEVEPRALKHTTKVLAGFLVLLGCQLWLSRYGLLVDGSSQVSGIFGYVDANARIPGLTGLSLACLVGAGVVVWAGAGGRLLWVAGAVGSVMLGGIALVQVFPALIQRFEVDPNELDREGPFIEHNLEATRKGFGLHDMTREPFPYQVDATLDMAIAAEQVTGFPTWNQDALLATFQSLEARFRYYRFSNVTIDRYPSADGIVPVALSVRELDPRGIENPNWQNRHVRERFVQGVGAVAASATAATAEGRPRMWLESIPPETTEAQGSPTGLGLDRPNVFFGISDQEYAVVTPTTDQFRAPDGTPGTVGVDIPRGIPLRSRALRFALAWAYQDPNLFFSSEVEASSQFIVHRRVTERVRKIAPFLSFLESPQAVIHNGRIVWILDAFTSSAHYPLSTRFPIAFRRSVNYLRGSVKVTVDSVTGDVRFFVVDEDDSLLEAYRAVFPDLFEPLDAMDEELGDHLRYPSSLLTVQTQVLRTYHQETAQQFHGQEDVWATPQETGRGTASIEYRPEYARYRLPGSDTPEFLLSTVFVPIGLQNLTATLVARSDEDRYGDLRLHEFRIEDGVPGPRQVEALIEQDPVISQQFSLWRQGGSQVWTGHLHLVPVGPRILYMEPVFLAAEEDAIPELRRFVVSDGSRVAMEETLAEALDALGGTGALLAGSAPTPGADIAEPPAEALQLLNQAEEALRSGDWAAFGRALEQLRARLEEADTVGPPSS